MLLNTEISCPLELIYSAKLMHTEKQDKNLQSDKNALTMAGFV